MISGEPSNSKKGNNVCNSQVENPKGCDLDYEFQLEECAYNEDQSQGHSCKGDKFIKICQESNWSDTENSDFEFNIDEYISLRDARQRPPNRPMNAPVRRTAVVRRPRNTHLTIMGKHFHDKYYALFVNKKRNNVKKPCVIHFHELARSRIDNLIRPLTRDEKRNLNLYYNNHASEMFRILNAIALLQRQGIINYP